MFKCQPDKHHHKQTNTICLSIIDTHSTIATAHNNIFQSSHPRNLMRTRKDNIADEDLSKNTIHILLKMDLRHGNWCCITIIDFRVKEERIGLGSLSIERSNETKHTTYSAAFFLQSLANISDILSLLCTKTILLSSNHTSVFFKAYLWLKALKSRVRAYPQHNKGMGGGR